MELLENNPHYYNMPSSTACNLMAEIITAGDRLSELSKRKKQTNHSTAYSVFGNEQSRRLVKIENEKNNFSIDIDDIRRTCNGKLFTLLLIKICSQAVFNGQIERNEICFPIQELIELGVYRTPQSARKGLTDAKHLFIIEGKGTMQVNDIRERVEKHIQITGNKPIIFIDYLQHIAPPNDSFSDKKCVDFYLRELKRINEDFEIPVVAVSSFNRESYSAPVSVGSFKESGNIEYDTDLLIGLQYDGMDYRDDETEKSHETRVRKLADENNTLGEAGKHIQIQLKLLKERNGGKGQILLNFFPKFNCFLDAAPTAKTDDDELPFDSMFGDLRPIE